VTERALAGEETIDAEGAVVARGFVTRTLTLQLELVAWPLDGVYAEKAGKWPLTCCAIIVATRQATPTRPNLLLLT